MPVSDEWNDRPDETAGLRHAALEAWLGEVLLVLRSAELPFCKLKYPLSCLGCNSGTGGGDAIERWLRVVKKDVSGLIGRLFEGLGMRLGVPRVGAVAVGELMKGMGVVGLEIFIVGTVREDASKD